MSKLKSFFNSKGDVLILEIKISTHELAHANLDVEAFEKIMEYDKDPSLVSQLKAILGMIGLLESLEKDADSWNGYPYQYIKNNSGQFQPCVSYSTINPPFYGTNLNATQVKQQATQNATNLGNSIICYSCGHINTHNSHICCQCRAILVPKP